MSIYLINNCNRIISHIGFFVPIDCFNLKKNHQVTALHLAEHCTFGDRNQEDQKMKESFRFGGYTIEGRLTQRWLSYELTFFNINLSEAIQWFFFFIECLKLKSLTREFKFQKKELAFELEESKKRDQPYFYLMKKIFNSAPFNLSSGGLDSDIAKISSDEINWYKNQIYTNGKFILSAHKEELKFNFYQHDQLPMLDINQPKYRVKLFQSHDKIAIIFQNLNSENKNKLLYFLNYFQNEFDFTQKMDYDVFIYPNLSLISICSKELSTILSSLNLFFNNNRLLKMAKTYAFERFKEEKTDPKFLVRNTATDWVNLNLNTDQDFDQILKNFKELLLQI